MSKRGCTMRRSQIFETLRDNPEEFLFTSPNSLMPRGFGKQGRGTQVTRGTETAKAEICSARGNSGRLCSSGTKRNCFRVVRTSLPDSLRFPYQPESRSALRRPAFGPVFLGFGAANRLATIAHSGKDSVKAKN